MPNQFDFTRILLRFDADMAKNRVNFTHTVVTYLGTPNARGLSGQILIAFYFRQNFT
jgi:hypothetical protein